MRCLVVESNEVARSQILQLLLMHREQGLGWVVGAAGSMSDFCTAVGHLDPRALQYHLERGDFSRWLDDIIADKELAAQVAVWEDQLLAHRAADLERIRRQLVQAVEQRYLELPNHD